MPRRHGFPRLVELLSVHTELLVFIHRMSCVSVKPSLYIPHNMQKKKRRKRCITRSTDARKVILFGVWILASAVRNSVRPRLSAEYFECSAAGGWRWRAASMEECRRHRARVRDHGRRKKPEHESSKKKKKKKPEGRRYSDFQKRWRRGVWGWNERGQCVVWGHKEWWQWLSLWASRK